MERKTYLLKELELSNRETIKKINNIEEVVDVFFRVLDFHDFDKKYMRAYNELAGVADRVSSALTTLAEGNFSQEIVDKCFAQLNSTDVFLRKTRLMVEPEVASVYIIGARKEDKEGMGDICKNAGFDKNISIPWSNRRVDYGAHKLQQLPLWAVMQRIDELLFDYIEITYLQIGDLKKILKESERRSRWSPNEYLKQIVKSYEREEKNGFLYEDFHWESVVDEVEDYTVSMLVDNAGEWLKDRTGIKLIGGAGTGKTTALKRLEYEFAKRYLSKGEGTIPIFLSLVDIKQVDSIWKLICAKIQLEENVIKEFMKEGLITFIFDGFNEILDDQKRREVAMQIDDVIAKYYDETQIFFSSRNTSEEGVYVLPKAKKLCLREISLEEKLHFFKERVEEELFELLEKKAQESEAYFENFKTPFKMIQLIEVLQAQREVPTDVTKEYLEQLFQREREEKKDSVVNKSSGEKLLKLLSTYMLKQNLFYIPIGKINAILVEMCNVHGIKIDVDHFLEVMQGMEILKVEEREVQFFCEDYLWYFATEAAEDGIE